LAAVEPSAPVVPPQASGPTSLVAGAPSPESRCGKPEFPWNEPPPEIPGQAMIDALQREVYQLRCEVDDLRAEVLAAREDFRRQADNRRRRRRASPLYNDAMQMAIQGHDATAIAHRCGIARAEADLVVALARNRREGL
jgi:hypothetical protein